MVLNESIRAEVKKWMDLYPAGRQRSAILPALYVIQREFGYCPVNAQNELLETLLATLRVADGFESTRNDRTRQAQSVIVKTAEDYAMAQPGDRLYVTDLCKVARVSERTLEYAFKEIMGLSPVTYLSRLRLHHVRPALLAATHGSTTVTTEALNWGFWHFGEFSRAYKECFGELASEPLRRKP